MVVPESVAGSSVPIGPGLEGTVGFLQKEIALQGVDGVVLVDVRIANTKLKERPIDYSPRKPKLDGYR